MAKISKPKSKKTEKNLGAEVSRRIEIKDIRLINCKCEQLPNPDRNNLRVDISYEVNTKVDKGKNTILVFPKFTLKALSQEGKEEKSLIFIEAMFLAIYAVKNLDGLTDAHFDEFGKMNGVYNTWPYWREFVQNIISRMGLPRLILPAFRLGSSKTPEEEKKNAN